MSTPTLELLPFLTIRSGLSDPSTPADVGRLLARLDETRKAGRGRKAVLMTWVVIPLILAMVVTGALAPFITNMDVLGPIPGNVWIVSAIILTVRDRRRWRTARMAGLEKETGLPGTKLRALDEKLALDAKAIDGIASSIKSIDGYRMSDDMNKRIIEALAAAFLQAQVVPDIKFSESPQEKLEELRKRKKAVDGLLEGNAFNVAVNSAINAYAWAEKLLVNRQETLALLSDLGFPGLKLVMPAAVVSALAILEEKNAAAAAAQPVAPPVTPPVTQPVASAPRDLFEMGKAQFEARNFRAAKGMFEEVLAATPGHPNASFLLGTCLVELDRPGDAIPHLRLAADSDPNQRDFQHILGVALGRLERYDEGEVHLARAAFLGHATARALLQKTGMDWCRTCGSPFRQGMSCPRCAA